MTGKLDPPKRRTAPNAIPRDASRGVQAALLRQAEDMARLREKLEALGRRESGPSTHVTQVTQQTVVAPELQAMASVAMVAGTVVALVGDGLVPADIDDVAHKWRVVGVLRDSVDAGALATVTRSGKATYSGWAWARGDVLYVGREGALSTEPGEGVFMQPAGVSMGGQDIVVKLDTPRQDVYVQDGLPEVPPHPAMLVRTGQYSDPDIVELWATLPDAPPPSEVTVFMVQGGFAGNEPEPSEFFSGNVYQRLANQGEMADEFDNVPQWRGFISGATLNYSSHGFVDPGPADSMRPDLGDSISPSIPWLMQIVESVKQSMESGFFGSVSGSGYIDTNPSAPFNPEYWEMVDAPISLDAPRSQYTEGFGSPVVWLYPLAGCDIFIESPNGKTLERYIDVCLGGEVIDTGFVETDEDWSFWQDLVEGSGGPASCSEVVMVYASSLLPCADVIPPLPSWRTQFTPQKMVFNTFNYESYGWQFAAAR